MLDAPLSRTAVTAVSRAPGIWLLERGTWWAAGLRRYPPNGSAEILARDTAEGLVGLIGQRAAPVHCGLVILDFASAAEESVGFMKLLDPTRDRSLRLLALLTAEQEQFRWELLRAGCCTAIPQPLSVRELSDLCRNFLRHGVSLV